MKKIFAIIMTICLMASVFCVSVSALTFSPDDKIRVYGLKKGDTTDPIDGYTDFEEGWEAAVDYAEDQDFMQENKYERIVVEFLADWKANDDGEFGGSWGDGFRQSTIYVPGDTKMTINLNGHTIDRALKEWEYDGEVICIDSKADVIIENGTITGGWSGNGAGGIHIYENANVTLNNVNVEGNKTDDDNGGGIYLDSYATLTMNGGSLSKNEAHGDPSHGAGLYVDGATATLNNVTISENKGGQGVAIYAYDGFDIAANVTLNNCVIENNNGLPNVYKSLIQSHSPVYINGGEIKNNGQESGMNSLFYFDEATLYMTGTEDDMVLVKGNNASAVFCCYGNMPGKAIGVMGDYCEIVDNTGYIGGAERKGYATRARYWFDYCKFNNNNTNNPDGYDFYAYQTGGASFFEKCDLGDTTFNSKNDVYIRNSTGLEASIFGEGDGSLSMIVSILALIASVASIGFCVTLRKKITVPATANNAKTEDDE